MPIAQARRVYDAVVVGSGYGGSVAALRLAQRGIKTAVLERGSERVPGQFPRTLQQAAAEFQVQRGRYHVGSAQGLYDLHIARDFSVMVGCGLGGTSLINGNVMLQPEPGVLAARQWPNVLRNDLLSLQQDYQTAEHMLGTQPFPAQPRLQKLDALKKQGHALGGKLTLPPISVTFGTDLQMNAAGVEQPPCTLCGDCCSGCNVGAKNTVAMNYLPAARAAGADLFTQAKVQWVERVGSCWRVHLLAEQSNSYIDAQTVVLSAGTLGSTEILLRSQERGLEVSDQVGKNLSGNGDVIAFAYNNDMPVNAVGVGNPPQASVPPVGPVIAGLIDLRSNTSLTHNLVIQEGVLPSPLAPLLPGMLSGAAPLFGDDSDLLDSWPETKRALQSLVRGAYRGAVHNTQTYLVMAHESSTGELSLSADHLSISWPRAGKDPVFKRINTALSDATRATGGTFIANPLWSRALGRNLISVHPLGGCVMADSPQQGVVNDQGQVFDPSGGVHHGLYVLDGAIVPRSLGVNPGLTITALAERACRLMRQGS